MKTKTTEAEQGAEQRFLRVGEVAELLNCSESYAYKIMQQLNQELSAQGKITIRGRVSKRYLLERIY